MFKKKICMKTVQFGGLYWPKPLCHETTRVLQGHYQEKQCSNRAGKVSDCVLIATEHLHTTGLCHWSACLFGLRDLISLEEVFNVHTTQQLQDCHFNSLLCLYLASLVSYLWNLPIFAKIFWFSRQQPCLDWHFFRYPQKMGLGSHDPSFVGT